MKLNIHGNKIKVTDPIKTYLEEKIGRLDKYLDKSEEVSANIRIRLSGPSQVVEVTIPLKKIIIRAEERHQDLYAAIDLVSDKLERQIRKNKTRLKKKVLKDVYAEFIPFEVEEEEETKVVRRKQLETKPMNEEEAILQMELLGHEFFIFEDSETGKNLVLYKRKDNHYGIIEIN